MKLAVLKERRVDENRVAATPETVKKFISMGFKVSVEKDAGKAAGIPDDQFRDAGATIATGLDTALKDAKLVLKVQRPLAKDDGASGEKLPDELAQIPDDAALMAIMEPFDLGKKLDAYAKGKRDVYALELIPRITRAQSMDVLSSQANLAGYRAVIEAAYAFPKAFPMMMTAAGTVTPARVFVMGAGVAGLQAIATAKRLGAVVSATDVRMAAKEQVESLGGKFVMVEDEETKAAETSGGYAKEMSDEYKKKQAALIAETIAKQDIVICTALIPGRPAPELVSAEMVKSMKPGSVIIDLAAARGGNCALTQPGKIVQKNNVTIIGHNNFPAQIAKDASALYAKNLLNLVQLVWDTDAKAIKPDPEDEIVQGVMLVRGGKKVHERFDGSKPKKAAEKAKTEDAEEKKEKDNKDKAA